MTSLLRGGVSERCPDTMLAAAVFRSDGEAEKEGVVLVPYDGLLSSLTGRAS